MFEPQDKKTKGGSRGAGATRGGGTGAAALCGGGGQGDALLFHV